MSVVPPAHGDRAEPARAHGAPVATAVIRRTPDDFVVVEEPGFEPSGDGEHDFLYIEKIGANTQWVARQLARFAGVAERDVGYAGLKDRYARTRQWFSVRRPGKDGSNWQAAAIDGVSILDVTRNTRKLRRGAHRGNRFRIALRGRDIAAAADDVHQRVAVIGKYGVPNYFGEQRFGRDGANLELASELFAGKRLRRDARSHALSAARSLLFNAILAERVQCGSWNRLLDGDVANLDGSGSVFAVDAVTPELEQRALALDIHPTGTLWGSNAPLTRFAAAEHETDIAARYPDIAAGLLRARIEAASRPLRVQVSDLSVDIDTDVVWLGFSLPRGAFATTVLAELADYESRKST